MNLKIDDTIIVTINSLGKNGEGIASFEGCTLYIDGALPNEVIKARIRKSSRNYCVAEIIEILKASPQRRNPSCQLFGQCGGCQLMHLQYNAQLRFKQQKVIEAFSSQQLSVNVADCLPSPLPLGYRNKIQLPIEMSDFGPKIGLYAKSSHDLIEIQACSVHCSLGETIFQKIKQLLKGENLKAVLIKTSIHLEEVLVTLVSEENVPSFEVLAEKIMLSSPRIKGVVLNINKETTNVILGKEFHLLKGQPFITQKLNDLLFHISAASFFQVNTLQAEVLYSKALEISHLNGNETILDAYCGVGTFSLHFARHVKQVIGVECVLEAIEDAKNNALLNCITNTSFYCAPAEDFIQTLPHIDLIILNPPRKGCAESLLNAVKRLKPKKILYISCEPSTLARDVSLLSNYQITMVQPFDMFPQTMHVETIAQLEAIM